MTDEELRAVRDELLADIPLNSTVDRARKFLESCPTTTHALAALTLAVEEMCAGVESDDPWQLLTLAMSEATKAIALAEAASI